VTGVELGPMLQEQAEAAGAVFALDMVEALAPAPDGRLVLRCAEEDVVARAVLIAAGSSRRKLGVPGEERLEGRGVSHCAACDGPLFRGRSVCVIGGGDSAFGEAAVLAGHAGRVFVVFREAAPHARRSLVEALTRHPNVELIANAEVIAVGGDTGVEGIRLRGANGAESEVAVDGVFVYAGLTPDSGFVRDALRLDETGRIEADDAFRTSLPGVFVAGDIRSGAAYLLAAAAGDGALAALSATSYLRNASR
jgi:thioredoxin reductase (NADPH)